MLRDSAIETGGPDFPGVSPWDDDAWRGAFLDWVDERLDALGLRVAGVPTARVQIWSVVVGMPTDDGSRVWAKANPPGNGFEGRLAAALADWAPGETLPALAHDDDRAWWIAPDGGPTLPRRGLGGSADSVLGEPLRRFAELQQRLAGRIPEMLALGVPDRRPDRLPAILDEILDRHPLPDVADARSRIAELCDELATSPVPASIDHGDLSEDQIFGRSGGGYRFFDWGDASVAHPFTTLHVPFLDCESDDGAGDPATIDRLATAYLERWGDDRASRRAVALADRLGPIGRSVTWTRLFPGNEDNDAVADVIRSLLTTLLEPPRDL